MTKLLSALLILCAVGAAHAASFLNVAPGVVTGSVVQSRAGPGDSCYAPCAVFFDATGVTSSVVTDGAYFIELLGAWDFGDTGPVAAAVSCGTTVVAGAGFWSCGNRPGVNSKNTATGMVAAHVYESAGTYTVTSTVTDAASNALRTSLTVTVLDPDTVAAGQPWPGTRTECISQSGTFVGCPAGATTTTSGDAAVAMNAAQTSRGARRILFARGDVFDTCTAKGNLSLTGPGLLGAYGSGAKPVLRCPTQNPTINVGVTANTTTDWRVVDLEFGNAASPVDTKSAMNGFGSFSRFLVLRVYAHDIGRLLGLDRNTTNILNAATPCVGTPPLTTVCSFPIWDQVTVADSVASNIDGTGANGYGMFINASRLALLGNYVQAKTTGLHATRLPYVGKGILDSNQFEGGGSTFHALSLRPPCWLSTAGSVCDDATNDLATIPAGNYTEYVNVRRNKVVGSAGMLTAMGVEPENTSAQQRHRYVLVEANWIVAGSVSSGAAKGLELRCSNTDAVRNNVVDMTAVTTTSLATGISWTTSFTAPASDNVGTCGTVANPSYGGNTGYAQTYNNTVYYGASTSSSRTGLSYAAGGTLLSLVNNLVYMPSAMGAVVVTDATSGGVAVRTGNTGDSGVPGIAVSPSFANAGGSFALFTDFYPTSGYPVGLGSAPVTFQDALGRARSLSPDTLGALCKSGGCAP